ncbi:MAG TPA: carboxypeptidase regulatory-like domain-containing protein [Bryobacteraceae bacterium]
MSQLQAVLLLAAAVLLPSTSVFAQATYTAQLRGTISDNSNEVVPGAHVIATNDTTGVSNGSTTDGQGRQLLPALRPALARVYRELDRSEDTARELALFEKTRAEEKHPQAASTSRGTPSGVPEIPEAQNWTHFVRIAGHSLKLESVDAIVRGAADSHVYGIETDNDIPGRYDSFLDPTEKLKAIRAVAEKAHAAGNKAFVYIAGLECITANADRTLHSFFKDHPDWVQRKRAGEPAVFGGGVAFWVAKGDEDVWISPYAPAWRKIYMERVRQIAATGIDGIYVDIPYWMTHFTGWEDSWASFDDYTVAAFREKTGLDAKNGMRLGDFSDPAFRRWIDFRIDSLTEFMKEIDASAKAVNPRCMTIAEIYPGIEEEAVRVGSDVYELYGVVDAIAHEYEYGDGDHNAASRLPLDWFHYVTGMLTFRSFAAGKASWMLSYSWDGQKQIDPGEAMKNLFAAQLMAGTNSWDAKGHVMSGSNDLATRRAVFAWIAAHEKTFYRPRLPIRPIGVYFSPRTRDYFAREFIESYRGVMELLLQAHQEIQVVTPRTLAAFDGPALILPGVRELGDDELAALKTHVAAGKRLLVTGPGSDRLRELATIVAPECPGRTYYQRLEADFNRLAVEPQPRTEELDELRARFLKRLSGELKYTGEVEVTASPFVATQIARVDGKPHVFLVNFHGLKSKQNAVQIPARNVRVSFPDKPGARIFALDYLGSPRELSAERKDGRMAAALPRLDKLAVVWAE